LGISIVLIGSQFVPPTAVATREPPVSSPEILVAFVFSLLAPFSWLLLLSLFRQP
jgi:hypothetical protein